jgi:hypothetical protein
MANDHDKKVTFSLLDLAPSSPVGRPHSRFAIRSTWPNTRAVGVSPYWLAEHHNIPGIASRRDVRVIAHVAAGR